MKKFQLNQFIMFVFVLVASVVGHFDTAKAQCGWDWEQGQAMPGVTGRVYDMVVLPDGDYLVGGDIQAAGSISSRRLKRYNPTTSTWSDIIGGPTYVVYSLELLPDGNVLVAGDFVLSVSNGFAENVAIYNPVTGVWTSIGVVEGGVVRATMVLPQGDILVAGRFNRVQGIPATGLARYDPATQTWSRVGSFRTASSDLAEIVSLVLLPDGDVAMHGYFREVDGIANFGIIRLNPTNNVFSRFLNDYEVYYPSLVKVLSNGDLIIEGGFSPNVGSDIAWIARYNPLTDVWTSLRTGDSNITHINDVAELPNGDLLVVGLFYRIGGVNANRIARYNQDTGTWSAMGRIDSGTFDRLVPLPDGDLILCGYYGLLFGDYVSSIARFNPTSSRWSVLGKGLNAPVLAMMNGSDGSMYVSGNFSWIEGVGPSGVAKYDPNTLRWSSLGLNLVPPFYYELPYNQVRGLAEMPNGDIVVGGAFTFVNGQPIRGLARYSAVDQTWSSVGGGLNNGSATTLHVLSNGDLIVGGAFTSAGGIPANRIARYQTSTNTWSALGSGTNNRVMSIVSLPDGDLLVGGEFTIAGGVASTGIARFNPVTSAWSAVGGSASQITIGSIYSMAALQSGEVVIGGTNSIAKFNPDTNTWSALTSGLSGTVQSLSLLPDGNLIVAGAFSISGTNARNIAHFNTSTQTWSPLHDAGSVTETNATVVLANGDVLAGGAYLNRFTPQGSAPSIVQHPSNMVTCHTGEAAFSITASGESPLSYRWRKDGVPLDVVANPSAATAVLQLTDVTLLSEGRYDCIVVDGCETTSSAEALLTVCVGDFDCNGGVESGDIEGFLGVWTSGDTQADVNQDGGVDGQDVGYFFERWEAGC